MKTLLYILDIKLVFFVFHAIQALLLIDLGKKGSQDITKKYRPIHSMISISY